MTKWKVFFWVCALFFLGELLRLPFNDNLSFGNFVSIIIEGFSLLPIYGYAYQIVIGSKPIAITIFSINALITAAVVLVFTFPIFLNGTNFGMLAGFVVVGIIFGIFLYPQFMYAFKSDNLWTENA